MKTIRDILDELLYVYQDIDRAHSDILSLLPDEEKIDGIIRSYAFMHQCELGNEGIILEKSICEIAHAIVTQIKEVING